MPMFAPGLKNLRVKLQERKDAVLRADFDHIQGHLRTFLSFVESIPALSAIMSEAKRILTPEGEQEIQEKIDRGMHEYVDFDLPSDEGKRAATIFLLLKFLSNDDPKFNFLGKTSLVFRNTGSQAINELKDQVFIPLYHYVDEKIDDADLLLYILWKYKRVVEWFKRDDLHAKVMESQGKKEAMLDSHLREYLFHEGIDFPFSSPLSPQGRADVVIPDHEKPLALEIKLFDNENYKKNYIKKGFNQALKYAADYGQPAAYLVVFNLSGEAIEIGDQKGGEFFPTVNARNKTVFFIVVDLKPPEYSASEQKPKQPIRIDEAYLTSKEGLPNTP